MLTQMYINQFKLPQCIQHIIKDFAFYRMDSPEGVVIQHTKILKTCISNDILNATSRSNPSIVMNTIMNIDNSHTSEYWEFTGDVFIRPRYLSNHPIYLSAENCSICGNYRYTYSVEVVRQRSIAIETQKRIKCHCRDENRVVEDEEEYQAYLDERYYDF